MSTAVPPMPSETAPGLSEPQRIINTFVAPSKTFEDIRRNASWWLPWLIGVIFATSTALLFNKKVDLEPIIREQMASRGAAWDNLSKEQQDQQVAIGLKVAKITPYLIPVISIVGALIIGAILMAVFSFVHEASVPYSRCLAIFFYAGLPGIVTAILAMITLMTASDMEGRNPRNLVATNPAYFMDYQHTSKFLYGMAASLDIITIWVIVLLGIGFKVVSGKPKLTTGAAVGTVLAIYVLYRLVVSSLGWV